MTRNEIQNSLIDNYVGGERKGIILASVRVGKTRVGIGIIDKLRAKNILICYPNINVLNSWIKEFNGLERTVEGITFSTFASLEKNIGAYDLILIDECHLLSQRNRNTVLRLLAFNDNVLGLTGTLDEKTKEKLWKYCRLDIIAEYSTDQGIEDEIVSDYRVNIIVYEIDSKKEYWKETKTKKWKTTERRELNYLSKRVLTSSGEAKKWAAISRMRFINTCNSLKQATRKLLSQLKNNRYILFGADTKLIDDLDIPTYHSKSTEDNMSLFLSNTISRLGLCKLGSAGTTFPNLDTVVICDINSNSENLFQKLGRSLLIEEGKISNIYIVCSEEEFQQNWLNSALAGIQKEKITWQKI